MKTFEGDVEAGRRINNCSVEGLAQSHRMRFHFISVQAVSPWVEQPAAGFKEVAGRREERAVRHVPTVPLLTGGRKMMGEQPRGSRDLPRSPRRCANATAEIWWP